LKRELLIINGAIVGAGLVLSINPPQVFQNNSTSVLPQNTTKQTGINTDNSKVNLNTPKPTQSKTTQTTITPTATPISTPQPVTQAINGTFLGDVVDISYGNLQIKIIVKDNIITDVQAVQYPNTGKSGELNKAAIVTLRQETLAAQSSSISGVSGASYTSYGFYKSLVSALNKAGL
jgi:uncharacterized protein with FMN-binding domain